MIRLSNGCRSPFPRPSLVNVRRLDMACLPMIEEMNRNGILIDSTHFSRVGHGIALDQERIGLEINALAGYALNPESRDKAGEL